MADRQLVDTYLQGQIGRRVFIRRLVASGVSLAAATAYARILGAKPAEAASSSAADLYDEDRLIKVTGTGITPTAGRVLRGGLVQWDFAPALSPYLYRYTVSDPFGFITFAPEQQSLNSGYRAINFYAAGTFPYRVVVDSRDNDDAYAQIGDFPAKIQSLMRLSRSKVRKGRKVGVSWASKVAPANYVYDVQIRRPGGTFKTWKSGVTQPRADFRPRKKGLYRFRARLRRLDDGKRSGYSPVRTLRCVARLGS